VSVSEKNFVRIGELWEEPVRNHEPPMFAWLCTDLPIYPKTIGLKTKVHLRNDGQRPFIEVEPTEHPLALEQRNGVTLQRVEDIAAAVLQHQ